MVLVVRHSGESVNRKVQKTLSMFGRVFDLQIAVCLVC